MTVEWKDGHSRSILTPKETSELLQQDLATLSPEEREVVELILRGLHEPEGGAALLKRIKELEWFRTPVGLEEFVMNPFYLGNTCDNLYPRLLEDLTSLFAGDYREAIFTGAIGWGKTFSASIGVCYLLYMLSCMRDPHRSFGIAANSNISIVCLSGDTEFYEGATGQRVRFDRAAEGPCSVVGFNGRSLQVAESEGVISTGRREVFSLRTSTGRAIRATADHRFLTLDRGWQPVKRLSIGTPLALAAFMPEPKACQETLSNAELRLLGYLVSEGNTTTKHVQFGNTDGRLIEEYVADAKEIGCHDMTVSVSKDKRPGRKTYYNARERTGKRGQRNVVYRLQRLCEKHDLLGKDAAAKRIPGEVMKQPNRGLALFLNRLFAGDGSCHLRKRPDAQSHQGWKNFQFRYATTSEQLARDVADALLRFGIFATIRRSGPNTGWSPAWHVDFSRKEFVARFIAKVGIFGREDSYEAHGWRGHTVSSGDICWDEIVGIESVGEADTYCIKNVVGDPWFVANGFVTHNCLSVNEVLATKVAYENIATKIEASPYFQQHFPFEKTKKELRFPKKVWVAARASNDGSVLGLNVIGGLLDETNFMPKSRKNSDPRFNLEDRAETLYNAMQRRMKSRFGRKGRLPGILFVVSSKQTSDDFTAKRVEEAKGDPTIFVRDYALWDVKPEAYYSGQWFHVVVGDDSSPSRILKEEEDPDIVRAQLSDGCVLIEVPEDFRQDFEQNLEGAIRDLAGVATVAISPYIQRRDKIQAAIDPNRTHPCSVEIYDPSQPIQFYWGQLVGPNTQPGIPEVLERPLLHPNAPRHIHIDPSLRQDATGFAMGHVAGFTEVVRRDNEGNRFPERAPVIVMDLLLRIVPPIGDEIILGDIRKLVYQLSRKGFMITCVSIDSWNSADAIQKLNQRGFNAIQLSVDRTMAPYDLTKTALYEERLHFYRYDPLIKELQELEHDRVRRKVDHPMKGSKDVSDAVAGVVYTLTENSQHMPLPMMKSIPKTGDMWMAEHQQAALAGTYGSQDAPNTAPDVLLPPFLLGSE